MQASDLKGLFEFFFDLEKWRTILSSTLPRIMLSQAPPERFMYRRAGSGQTGEPCYHSPEVKITPMVLC